MEAHDHERRLHVYKDRAIPLDPTINICRNGTL